MAQLRIDGGYPLEGTLAVGGSKNSVLKLLIASLLTKETSRFLNVPKLEDVTRVVELLTSLGAECVWEGEHELRISPATIDPAKLDADCVRQLRSSALLMGSLVSRCGWVEIPGPGGDQIGARPLDAHFDAFRQMGISIQKKDGGVFRLEQDERTDVVLTMSEFSVTATENAILGAAVNKGYKTTIHSAAADASVQDLCWFLSDLGAKIEGVGTHTLHIEGVSELAGHSGYAVMPDPVEAGTFFCLAACLSGPLRISGVAPDFLVAELQKFREMGLQFSIEERRPGRNTRYEIADIVVHPARELKPLTHLHNMPYPGFSPDLLPPVTVLLTQAVGESMVHDWMYEGRLRYVEELNKMGAGLRVLDPHRVRVSGPVRLHGASITNYDIRAGACLVIASLMAKGESVISPVYQLDRGYEQLDLRLREIGARITREE